MIEDFVETYGFNYFSDYVIDEDSIILNSAHSILVVFPDKWSEDIYIVPGNILKVFR